MQLFRGLSVQLAYRWGTGQVRASGDNRAVLMWSRVGRSTSWLARCRGELRGLGCGVVVGLTLFLLSNAMLMLMLTMVENVIGLGWMVKFLVLATVSSLRLLVTLVRAVMALRATRQWVHLLPPCPGQRWRVDYLAAFPAGTGAGGRLLTAFVREADARDAEVVLVCDPRHRSFYRRHGFRVVAGVAARQEQVVMRRTAPSQRSLVRAAPRSPRQLETMLAPTA